MKILKIALLLCTTFLTFAQSSLDADEYLFALKEQPHYISLKFDKKHQNLIGFELFEPLNQQVTFSFQGRNVFTHYPYEIHYEGPLGDRRLILQDNIDVKVLDEIELNPWGDSPILRAHQYSIYIRVEITNNKVIGGFIEITDDSVQETSLWSDLILLSHDQKK